MEITPLIFLLQQLRDKRDLRDLPAIQIEYLILDAGEEWGLIPGVHGGVQVVGGLKEVFPALEKNWCHEPEGLGIDWASSAQAAPYPTSRSPTANCTAQPLPARGISCRIILR